MASVVVVGGGLAGLSATARPVEAVAGFLGGDRPVEIVDATERPRLDLEIVVPVEDMERPEATRPPPAPESTPTRGDYMEPEAGLWPALLPRLLEAIQAHGSTLLFVNSRGLCERLTRRLNELAGEELVRAHHGSVAHEQRRAIESALKQGEIVFVYTDGFYEAMNAAGKQYGIERLHQWVRQHRTSPSEQIVEELCCEILRYTNGLGQNDDMTMVVVKKT